MKPNIEFLEKKAYNLRVLSLKATTQAGSGHPTSALSAADMVAALFFYAMKFDPTNPYNPFNDRFILSKGHAAPVLYAAWEQIGVINEQELMTLRKFDSVLEGHPTPRFAYNEAAKGSLGIGLSIGLGMALSTRVTKHEFYTYVMMGDSEMAEGSIWESCELAAYYKVNNLIGLIDVNRLGQSTQTIEGHNIADYKAKLEAFGWQTFTINGHNMQEIVDALDEAKKVKDKPSMIIACTCKGYGLTIEDKPGYHGKAFSKEELPELLNQLEKRFYKAAHADFQPAKKIEPNFIKLVPEKIKITESKYIVGAKIATRKAYGEALADCGEVSQKVISLDAEVKNSTFAEIFEKYFPERFFQCFVAEQNMVGMAIGFASRDLVPFASTFGAFMTRAHDQIRMAAIGRSPLRLAGSHCGVSIGQDGPSQMALEDIAMMRAIPDSIVLYPSDGTSTHKLVNSMLNYYDGISYLRLTRAETPVLYAQDEEFKIGGCKVIRQSEKDSVCIIGAGITLHEALKAYEVLKAQDILVSVIDLYSVKPMDTETIKKVALKSQSKVITVEDHFMQGGLGEAVCFELRNMNIKIELLAVKEISRSGEPEELLAYHKIDSNAIVETVQKITRQKP